MRSAECGIKKLTPWNREKDRKSDVTLPKLFIPRLLAPLPDPVRDLQEACHDRYHQGDEGKQFDQGTHGRIVPELRSNEKHYFGGTGTDLFAILCMEGMRCNRHL